MSRYRYILAVDEGDGVGGSRWKMNQQTKGEMKGTGGRGVRSERKDSITCLGCCIMASLQPVFKNVRLHRFLSVAAVACSVCLRRPCQMTVCFGNVEHTVKAMQKWFLNLIKLHTASFYGV